MKNRQLGNKFSQRDLGKLIDSARLYNICEKDVVERYCKYLVERPDPDIKKHHEMAYERTHDYIIKEGCVI